MIHNNNQWSGVSKGFHWLMAVLIVGMLILGFVADEWPLSPTKLELFKWHKSFGLLALGLAMARLVWRFLSPPPAAVPMAAWQRAGSRFSHFLLYALMLAQPITGWLTNSAANVPLKFFGWFTVPPLIGNDKELRSLFGEIHEVLAWTLVVLLSVHVLAALKHHFIDKDMTLKRMLPFGSHVK